MAAGTAAHAGVAGQVACDGSYPDGDEECLFLKVLAPPAFHFRGMQEAETMIPRLIGIEADAFLPCVVQHGCLELLGLFVK